MRACLGSIRVHRHVRGLDKIAQNLKDVEFRRNVREVKIVYSKFIFILSLF